MLIHLNGGPLHDQTIEMPEGRDHFHIAKLPNEGQHSPYDPERPVFTRQGTYSRCEGYPGEFEFDGWGK